MMIPSLLFLTLTLILTLTVGAAPIDTTPTLVLSPLQQSHAVSETLWGVFFEEINHAGQVESTHTTQHNGEGGQGNEMR